MADDGSPPILPKSDKRDYATLIAFLAVVVLSGSIGVAVRISNFDLPPFWGAGIRSGTAGLIFWLLILVQQIALPNRRALIGALLYGILTVGFGTALFYWGLLRLQASLASVVLAVGPLMTIFFASAHGLEKFRWRGVGGCLIAIAGIALTVGEGIGTSIPVESLGAMLAGAACLAEGSVVFKLFPQPHPHATNAIALSIGSVFLLALSLIVGEVWRLPSATNFWIAFVYLVIFATVGLYYLYLYVLSRWTASATNYSFLLTPIATVLIAAWLLGESITIPFILGSGLISAGVWLGAFSDTASNSNVAY